MTEPALSGFTGFTGVGAVMAAQAARAAQGDAQAAAFVASVAAWRQAFAAAPGARWALYFEGTADFAAALFGAWHAGKHVVLPGDTRPETLAALRGHADALGRRVAGRLDASARNNSGGRGGRLAPARTHDTWVTLFTSGSTGEPGAIDKRLAQLDAEVHTLQHAFGARLPADVRVLSTVSHQHIYGLLFTVLWPLAAGRPMPGARLAFHEELVRACADDARPAVLVSSPAHLKAYARCARLARHAPGAAGGVLVRRAAPARGRGGRAAPHRPLAHRGIRQLRDRRHRLAPARRAGGPLDRAARHRLAPARTASWPCARRTWPTTTGTSARTASLPAGDDSFVLAGRADRIVKIEEKRVSLTAMEQRLAASPLVREARVVMVELHGGTRLAASPWCLATPDGAHSSTPMGEPALTAALRAQLADAVDRGGAAASLGLRAGAAVRTRRARPPKPCCVTCSAARCRPRTGWTLRPTRPPRPPPRWR